MILEIGKCNIRFYPTEHYIKCGSGYTDIKITQYLDLSLSDYLAILQKYNGISWRSSHFFKKQSDGEAALKELEPYLIMAILTRGVEFVET